MSSSTAHQKGVIGFIQQIPEKLISEGRNQTIDPSNHDNNSNKISQVIVWVIAAGVMLLLVLAFIAYRCYKIRKMRVAVASVPRVPVIHLSSLAVTTCLQTNPNDEQKICSPGIYQEMQVSARNHSSRGSSRRSN